MIDKLEAIRLIYRTNPVTPEALKKAEELGMIPKRLLKDGKYYKGSCRNANIAMWDEKKNVFFHLRTKFGETFSESIPHPENDKGFDVFTPVEEVTGYDNDAPVRVRTISQLEVAAIENAITRYKGNLTEAAQKLGIGRATLYRKIKEHNLEVKNARQSR